MIDVLGPIFATEAADAAKDLADSLNQGSITGWDLVAAAIVVVLSVPLSRLAGAAIRHALKRAGIASPEAAADLARVARWLVYLLGFAMAASILGVNIGFLSVLFAFALIIAALMLKPMVENSASGILLAARPDFSVGDQIRTTDFRGSVEGIGSRATRLRREDGVVVFVSNNQVLGNPILVYSESESRKATFDIRVPATTDLDDVTSVLMKAATSVDQVVDKPSPSIQATGLTDNAIKLSINYWYPSTMINDSDATDAVIRATTSALREANIELIAPEVDVKSSPSKPAAPPTGGDDDSAQAAGSG